MDPEIVRIGTEVLKHGPDAVKAVGAVVGSVKFTEITKAMLGPAANEVAERIHDEVRLYRFGRQLELLKKAEKMAKDAGFTPKAVPVKLLFPMLEGASLEEDENLHDMWAALLANASSPEHSDRVRPGYIALLRQMAADEAALLNAISAVPEQFEVALLKAIGFVTDDGDRRQAIHEAAPNVVDEVNGRLEADLRSTFPEVSGEDGETREQRYHICFQTLKAEGLIEAPIGRYNGPCRLSARGKSLLAACTPPQPKP